MNRVYFNYYDLYCSSRCARKQYEIVLFSSLLSRFPPFLLFCWGKRERDLNACMWLLNLLFGCTVWWLRVDRLITGARNHRHLIQGAGITFQPSNQSIMNWLIAAPLLISRHPSAIWEKNQNKSNKETNTEKEIMQRRRTKTKRRTKKGIRTCILANSIVRENLQKRIVWLHLGSRCDRHGRCVCR